MSNRNFNYLKYSAPPPILQTPPPQPSYSNTKSNKTNKINTQQIRNSVRKVENIISSKPVYDDLKRVLKETLERDVERPFMENLLYLKKVRGEDEYKDAIKKIYEEIAKQKANTEKALVGVKKYLDYMEPKNRNMNSNKSLPRLFLPGLEGESKLDPIYLPDLLGFTKSPAQSEIYSNILVLMARTFLNLDGKTPLLEAIKTIEEFLKNIRPDDISNDVPIKIKNFEENLKKDSRYRALYKIRIYYYLLKMLDTGKFNLDEIVVSKKVEEDIRYKAEPFKPIYGQDKGKQHKHKHHDKGKHKGKPHKGKFFKKRGGQIGGDQRTIADMISYIIHKEDVTANYNDINNKFQRAMKDGGQNAFKIKVTNNNTDILNLFNEATTKSCVDSFSKDVKEFSKCIRKNISGGASSSSSFTSGLIPVLTTPPPSHAVLSTPPASVGIPPTAPATSNINKIRNKLNGLIEEYEKTSFYNIAENYFDKNKIDIYDLYNGELVSVQIRNVRKDSEDFVNKYRMFYMTFVGYYNYYESYTLERLIKPQYGLEAYKDALNIVRGIGVYLVILLDQLNKLESKLNSLGIEFPRVMSDMEKKIYDNEKRLFLKEIENKIRELKTSSDENKQAKINKLYELQSRFR